MIGRVQKALSLLSYKGRTMRTLNHFRLLLTGLVGVNLVHYTTKAKENESNTPNLEYIDTAQASYWIDEEGKRQGKYISMYDNGKKRFEFSYKDDKLEGAYREWHANGQKFRECIYKNGKLEGAYLEWHDNGQKCKECYYKNNELEGKYTAWHNNSLLSGFYARFFLPTKKLYYKELIFKNGKITKIISMIDGDGRETVLPEGEIVVWKACKYKNTNVYVKIKVPKEAKRVTVYSRDPDRIYKARIEYGTVIEIVDEHDNNYTEATSFICPFDKKINYIVGQQIRGDGYDDDINTKCGQGISVHRYKDHCRNWFYKYAN